MTFTPVEALSGQLQRAQINAALGDIGDAAFGVLASDYTLTSTTNAQKLFNWSTNGAVTLPAGRYLFDALFEIDTMDATSGNAAFSFAGAATLADVRGIVVGGDATAIRTTVAGLSGQFFVTATQASMVTATAGTAMAARISGGFNVTAAGTVIPSVALVTATAAVVKAGSFFVVRKVAADGAATFGDWS